MQNKRYENFRGSDNTAGVLPVTATPIQKLRPVISADNTIYMKRDDLLPFSFGGNKVRIADAFLRDMYRTDCDALIMYGDLRSNLCRVLANACVMLGIPGMMVATSEHADNAGLSFNEQMIRSFHVPVIFCEKDAIPQAVDQAFEQLRNSGRRPYYIYGNRYGTGHEGVAAGAYAAAAAEIAGWEAENGLRFDRIVTACGTGSTAAGLAAGFLRRGDERPVTGISISSRTPERARQAVYDAVRSCLNGDISGKKLPDGACIPLLEIHTEYNAGGYGICTDRIRRTIAEMLRVNGIPLDPVYTGKAFLGMLDLLRDRQITGENILFLHTGGLPLYFDYLMNCTQEMEN